MDRIRHGRKRWRTKWPWRWLFPLTIDERVCRRCGLPYHNGPLPKEIAKEQSGNVALIVYPAGGFRRGETVVQVGRWSWRSGNWFHSQFIPTAELDDLFKALSQLRQSEPH